MRKVSVGRLLRVIVLLGIVSLAVAACSGAISGTQQPQVRNTDVEALPGDRAEMQIALPDGSLPCGIGQVEWGEQVFKLDLFPSCKSIAPALTVYCLDDQAKWTADLISVKEITMTTLTIDAQREGICAIFQAK